VASPNSKQEATLDSRTQANVNQIAGDLHLLTAPIRFLFRCVLALIFLLLAPLLYAAVPFACIVAEPNSDFSMLALEKWTVRALA
jgi:hypothetical protein